RQEARAELIRARTEPEVEAGGLVLVVSDRPLGADPPVADGGAELMVGQDAVGYGAQPITRLRAPDVSTSSAHAAPAIPARRSTASIAAATGAPSPATTASSDGPAPLRTQPSAPAARAALTTSGIHGNNRSREGSCSRSSKATPSAARRQAAHPRRGARAEPARRGHAVRARERAPLEWASRRVVGELHAARDHVVGGPRQPRGALTLDRDAHPLGLGQNDLVVERPRQAERVEPWAEVGGRRGDADVDAHAARAA